MEAEEDDSTEVEQKPNNNDTDSNLGTEDPLEISEAIATMSPQQRVTQYLNPAKEALEAIIPRLHEALASCQDEAILEGLQDSIIQINLRADNYLSTFSDRKPGYVANALKQLLPHNSPRSRGDSVDVVCGSPKRRRGIDQTTSGDDDTASAENAKDGRGDAERDPRLTKGLPRALKQLLPHTPLRSRDDDVVCGSPKRRHGIDQTTSGDDDTASAENTKDGRGDAERDHRSTKGLPRALKQLLPHNSPRSRGDSVDVVCGSPKRRRGIDQTTSGDDDTASAENAKDGRGDAERDPRLTKGLPRALKQLLPHTPLRSRDDDVVCGSPKRRHGIDQTTSGDDDNTSIINSRSSGNFVETTRTVTTTTSIVESSKHDVSDISSDFLDDFGNIPQSISSSHSRELEKQLRTYNTPAGSESRGGRKETDEALNSSHTRTKKRGSTLSSGVIESASIIESKGVTDKERMWSCHICTFRNKATDARCAICGAVRPRTAVTTAKPLKLVRQYHRKINNPRVKGSSDSSTSEFKNQLRAVSSRKQVIVFGKN